MTSQMDRWQARIQLIKQNLLDLGPMRPGALSEQYNVCGKPNCKCKDPSRPQKHGPYFQLSYVHEGKSTTEHVTRDMLDVVREQLTNYATYKKLTCEWVDLSIQIAKLQRKQSRS